jgi:hypothetical protein
VTKWSTHLVFVKCKLKAQRVSTVVLLEMVKIFDGIDEACTALSSTHAACSSLSKCWQPCGAPGTLEHYWQGYKRV